MLWWQISENKRLAEEAEQYKLKYGSETSEYIKQYEEWMLLPVEERAEMTLELDLNANKTPDEIIQDQHGRLIADLDKLATGNMTIYPFADEFYGHDWQQKIVEYKRQNELKEIVFTCSFVCISIGSIVTGWIVLLNFARLLIKIVSGLKAKISGRAKTLRESKSLEDGNLENEDTEGNSGQEEKSDQEEKAEPENKFKNLPNVLVNSGWQYAGSFGEELKSGTRPRKRIPLKSKACIEHQKNKEVEESGKTDKTEKEQSEQAADNNDKNTKQDHVNTETVIKSNVDIEDKNSKANPIDSTLRDLTQQVSAIREYAANQQNRLKRFQDGYDWNILKTFCLRMIRCIDNIENRISQLSGEGVEVSNLEEVRDELIFALESSGIEQFEPDVNSEYRGQEKIAEAVKEKTKCKEPDKKGKIEKVIRPGYQFYIDDENIRIVRPAQVRLFA